MNDWKVTGRLVADPELTTFGDNKSKVTFRLANRKRFVKEGEQDSDFFTFVAFGATAEFIAKYFKKGSSILIERAEVHNNNYTKDDGTKVYGQQFIAQSVEFYGSGNSGNKEDAANDSAPAAAETAKSEPKKKTAPAKTESYDEYDDF